VGLNPLARRSLAAGAALMLLGVVLGAFGAHALAERLTPRELDVFRVGVNYQQWHALGLLVIGVLARDARDDRLLAWAACALFIGIVLFSGSLYLLTAGAPRVVGAITPVGGLSFIAGWALLFVYALRSGR
jgi:uncharacterized membrane protein YgdD (TMEM256/DUF423 family)